MTKSILLLSTLFALTAAEPARAAPPAALKAEVMRFMLAGGEGDLRGLFAGAPRRAPAEMFSPVDINGDGLTDWRVDYEQAPNPSFFCGSGGCRQQLFVAAPRGRFVLVFDHVVGQLKLETRAGERSLELNFHGSMCGRYGAAPCPRRFAWVAAARRYVERPHKEGTRLNGPLVQPVPLTLAQAPAAVRAQVRRLQAGCIAERRRLEEPATAIDSVPDLNGDGLRDWVVGGRYVRCSSDADSGPDLGLTILTSAPGGAFGAAYRTNLSGYAVDIGSKPATLFIETSDEDCAAGKGRCPPIRLVWDAATRRLKPR